jgi:hypothetical protein
MTCPVLLAYDAETKRTLLITRTRNEQHQPIISLWSFDGDKEVWTLHDEQSWDGEIRGGAGLALDEANRVLVLTQSPHTFLFQFDLETLPASPAPEPLPPMQPTIIPPDDPTWLAKLKSWGQTAGCMRPATITIGRHR